MIGHFTREYQGYAYQVPAKSWSHLTMASFGLPLLFELAGIP